MPNWKKLITSGSAASLSNLYVQNAVTASYFVGDGSALTGVTTDIAETATVSDTFTSDTEKIIVHNFGTKNVIVTVYNDSDEQILPSSIVTTDINTVTVTLDTATSGRVVVAKGGHIVQGVGTASNSNTLNGQSGSYYLDFANHTGAVTASAVVVDSGTITVNDGNVIITGSLSTSGSAVTFNAYPWPQIGEETHLLRTDGYEIIFNEATRSYEYHGIALEHIENFTNYYHNSLTLYTFGSGSEYGGEVNIGPVRTHMRQYVSGSTSLANVSVQELQDGRSQALVYGDKVEIGVFRGANLQIGNTSSIVSISGSSLNIGSDITASGHFVPSTTEIYDLGTADKRWRDLYLSGSTINLGGTLITRDTNGNIEFKEAGTNTRKTLKVDELEIQRGDKSVRLKLDNNNKVRFEDTDSGDTLSPTFFKQAISGASIYYVTHSLDEDFPVVQIYTPAREQVIPKTILSTTSNTVKLEFDSSFTGTVVVKK